MLDVQKSRNHWFGWSLVDIKQLEKFFEGYDGKERIDEALLHCPYLTEDSVLRLFAAALGQEFLPEAVERVMAGPERRSRIISPEEKEIIAYHEAGHALVMGLLPGCDPVHKVSVVARGMALGYTMPLPEDDRYLQSRGRFRDELAGLLGGRAAEELVFDDVTTGAANDLERATRLARKMVTEYGMSERLGPLTFGQKEE